MTTTVIENVRIIDPSRGLDEVGTIIIENDLVVAAAAGALNQGRPEGAQIFDARGLVAMPGLVDTRVFVGEPGAEHRETIQSAAVAAASGGITSFFTMPDTSPVIDDVAMVEFIKRNAEANACVNVYPVAALTKALEGNLITEFGLMRRAGAIAFSNGHHSIQSAQVMRRAMIYAKDFGAIVMQSPKDDTLGNGVMNSSVLASWLGLAGVPREAESIPLQRDMALAKLTGAAYHVETVSCAQSIKIVKQAKEDGLDISSAVCINHATLNEIDIGEYRTFFRLEPPLRSEDDRRAIVQALASGVIDMVNSSHDPQDVETKRLPFADATPGAIGLETMLSALLRLYHSGDLTLLRIAELVSTAPARRFGLNAGSLKPGSKADIALVDVEQPWIVNEDELLSRCRNTCFEGARFQGKVVKTWRNGKLVFQA